jgi:hypothetical protein
MLKSDYKLHKVNLNFIKLNLGSDHRLERRYGSIASARLATSIMQLLLRSAELGNEEIKGFAENILKKAGPYYSKP